MIKYLIAQTVSSNNHDQILNDWSVLSGSKIMAILTATTFHLPSNFKMFDPNIKVVVSIVKVNVWPEHHIKSKLKTNYSNRQAIPKGLYLTPKAKREEWSGSPKRAAWKCSNWKTSNRKLSATNVDKPPKSLYNINPKRGLIEMCQMKLYLQYTCLSEWSLMCQK